MQPFSPVRIGEHEVVALSGSDTAIPTLLAACRDFFVRHHLGNGQEPTIEHLMADLSPAHRSRTRWIGLKDKQGELVGLVMLVKDWQRPRQWCLRVQILHPASRRQGLGARLYHAVKVWAQAQGAAAILIGVLASNRDALRFWRRLGFHDVRRDTHTSGETQCELEHRFCNLPLDQVAPLGSTLARQWQRRLQTGSPLVPYQTGDLPSPQPVTTAFPGLLS